MCLTAMQVGGPVGVQALNQSGNDWYSRSQAYGMGRRECRNVEPQLQVTSPNCRASELHCPAPHSASAHTDLQRSQPTAGACRSDTGADAQIWQSAGRKPRWWRGWLLRASWFPMPCHRAWQPSETDRFGKTMHVHM